MEIEPPTTTKSSIPWVEKYRPSKMSDVSYQDEAVMTLRKSIEEGNLPHLLLYGPPGTGKTSVILALAKELFGPKMRNRVMELNASDERGIDVIRRKVVLFAQQTVNERIPGYPSPPYKIIIMDEADSLTMDAQSALRRVMEMYSSTTRFCFICNYISKIIPALSSRCAKFEFGALPRENVVSRLKFISEQEKMQLEEDAYSYIYDQTRGDLRSGIHLLQNSSMIYSGKVITRDDLQRISMEIPEMEIKLLWSKIVDVCKGNSIKPLSDRVEKAIQDGYPLSLFLAMLSRFVLANPDLNDTQKADISMELASADKAAVDGCDEEIVLLNTCCSIVKMIQ